MCVDFQRFGRLLALLPLCACVQGAPYGFEPEKSAADDSYAPPIAAPACQPNNDGVITKDEMPFVVGITARIRVGEGPLTVNVDGFDDNGTRRWDLSTPLPETQPLAKLELQNIEGQWFSAQFPNAQYAGPLQPGGGILGPLKIMDDGVYLLGSASAKSDPSEGKTLVIYDTPVKLYPFPLQDGAHASTTARANNATIQGLPTAFTDIYDVTVTGRGTVVLPDLILENTLRVTLRLKRTLVVGDVQQVTHVFVHECFGEVARIISETARLSEELPDNFTTASQVWRLSL